ncbi:MAG: undecaprenyl-diphosphate phosphatase [Pseudomonadota bacterium]
MELLDIIALAIIQGITEFLPISSSGHLALWPILTGRTDQGVVMDVAVHLGTLVAVCLFFRAEVGKLFVGTSHIATGRTGTEQAKLTLLLVVATVPAVIAGLTLKLTGALDAVRADQRLLIEVIGWATLGFGILLWLADKAVDTRGPAETWTLRDAILMGLAQAIALIPGTSRSGITMTAGRWLGFDRTQAARLALLMAVPTILAAGTVETLGVLKDGNLKLGLELALGAALSCIAALAALWAMMRMFASAWTMTPFVLYRLALGILLLGIAYGVIPFDLAAPPA